MSSRSAGTRSRTSSSRSRTPYDEFPYPGFPYAQTHPDRLATLATLFGMSPAPVERCRVLELGCGDAGNLLPMAYGLPDSEFVGIDRAATAIRKGRRDAGALGLDNISLIEGDLTELDVRDGEFDFILAHGVYSWVSDRVRDRLLEVCRTNLAPDGVAYVSYNTLPGGHLRRMLREMMLIDGRGLTEPHERASRARAFLRDLEDAAAGSTGYKALIAEQLERTLRQSDAGIVHDDLAPENRAVYFHEFAAHAAAHRLQYLAEADFFEMHVGVSSPSVLAALEQRGDDVIGREQYLDFLKCRMYRQTLLCHDDVRLQRGTEGDRVARFLIESAATPTDRHADLEDRSVVEFRAPHGASLRTDEPVIKRALGLLGDHSPCSLPFDALRPDGAGVLADSLLRAYAANVVRFHVHQPRFAADAGERPRASALARLQASAGEPVTTLTHRTVRIEDPAGRRLLTLLDGTHDRAELATLMSDGVEDPPGALIAKLDSKLADLARLALLEPSPTTSQPNNR